jgi:hypothetical protein
MIPDYKFNGTIEGIVGGLISGIITIPDTPPTEPPIQPPTNGGTKMPAYSYAQQYADTESNQNNAFKRIINPNQSSQWGSGMTIAPGPYPPGYRIPNGQEGGGFPPSGQQSNGTLPIRLQPPSSGNGQKFVFYTSMTCTLQNESDIDGRFIWALGVIYPSEVDRPMMPYLGLFHAINDFRIMVPITVPKKSSVVSTAIRVDILDPDFAAIPGWPSWKMVPNANKLWPAVGPTCMNPGPAPINVKDIMAVGVSIPY